jgi:hypothetical protein
MAEDKEWRKAELYAKKLFQFLTVKADHLLKKEDAVIFVATWQALSSRMICTALLMNELHGIGQNESELISSMVDFAVQFKKEHYENIRRLCDEGKNAS